MESLLKEIKIGIYELEDLKEKYPRIETVNVIKMLKRLEQKVKSLLPVVNGQSEQLKDKHTILTSAFNCVQRTRIKFVKNS